MPLPSFDSKDKIPAGFEDAYAERDGKFVPIFEDATGLRESQRRALDEKKKLESQLSGILGNRKLEDVAALIQKAQEDEEKSARAAGDFDKLLEKRVNETKAESEKRIAELTGFKTKYEDRELDIAIRDGASKGGVISEDMKHVLAIVKGSRIKYDPQTGKAVVYDADGDPTGLTVEKFFSDTFKQEAPKFYAMSGGSGGGAAASGGSGVKVGAGAISRTDNAAMLANLDAVAKGTMKVV